MKKTNLKSHSARGLPAKPKHQQTAAPGLALAMQSADAPRLVA